MYLRYGLNLSKMLSFIMGSCRTYMNTWNWWIWFRVKNIHIIFWEIKFFLLLLLFKTWTFSVKIKCKTFCNIWALLDPAVNPYNTCLEITNNLTYMWTGEREKEWQCIKSSVILELRCSYKRIRKVEERNA